MNFDDLIIKVKIWNYVVFNYIIESKVSIKILEIKNKFKF